MSATGKALETLVKLGQTWGPDQLREFWKNCEAAQVFRDDALTGFSTSEQDVLKALRTALVVFAKFYDVANQRITELEKKLASYFIETPERRHGKVNCN